MRANLLKWMCVFLVVAQSLNAGRKPKIPDEVSHSYTPEAIKAYNTISQIVDFKNIGHVASIGDVFIVNEHLKDSKRALESYIPKGWALSQGGRRFVFGSEGFEEILFKLNLRKKDTQNDTYRLKLWVKELPYKTYYYFENINKNNTECLIVPSSVSRPLGSSLPAPHYERLFTRT